MKIKRKDKWGGEIVYDTAQHSFIIDKSPIDELPNPSLPLVLNVDLLLDCNMCCNHCVAEDMAMLLGGKEKADLKITNELIDKINSSPFMVVVITGGEPFLQTKTSELKALIKGLKKKAIIIDTNGTIKPPSSIITLLKKKEGMVRISWDIPHPNIEVKLRKYPSGMYESPLHAMTKKEDLIKEFLSEGICVGIQTVFHQFNYNNDLMKIFPKKLKELGIKHWYLQRFIPSHKVKDMKYGSKKFLLAMGNISDIAKKYDIKCHYKKDKRHNSVFLLVKNGALYTQSDNIPGKKVLLGQIGDIDYFQFVSSPDHAARYFV